MELLVLPPVSLHNVAHILELVWDYSHRHPIGIGLTAAIQHGLPMVCLPFECEEYNMYTMIK